MQFLIASTGARGTKALWVEAQADVIKVLSERIVQTLVPPSARAARAAASAAAARPPARGCQPDERQDPRGKISFPPDRQAWLVSYQKKNNTRGQTSKNLSAPTKSLQGVPLDRRAYKRQPDSKLEDAKRLWNERDCSDRPRFLLTR